MDLQREYGPLVVDGIIENGADRGMAIAVEIGEFSR
jgi:hypothetical protein